MSVLIKGMEMPTNCEDCVLLDEEHSKCKLHDNGFRTWNEEYAHCPLVSVPPHGRLIDADGSIGINVRMMPGGKCEVDLIAPTIIPASEEGECEQTDNAV